METDKKTQDDRYHSEEQASGKRHDPADQSRVNNQDEIDSKVNTDFDEKAGVKSLTNQEDPSTDPNTIDKPSFRRSNS